MRGDRPIVVAQRDVTLLFTPHARGSTLTPPFCLVIDLVYPACAGIDRLYPLLDIPRRSLPRMRGDRPSHRRHFLSCHRFTPHARGSTYAGPAPPWPGEVYPACAGIDPGSALPPGKSPGLPRMRGDRP